MKSNIHNLFLTGAIHAGKTTVLNKVLAADFVQNYKIMGFKTRPIIEQKRVVGYYIETTDGEIVQFAHKNSANGEKFNQYHVEPSVFNDVCVNILTKALFHADIILVDEIGIIEKRAGRYKDIIEQCLNSSTLFLAIYQQRAEWFRKLIEKRSDVLTFNVTTSNRSSIHLKIIKKLKIILTN